MGYFPYGGVYPIPRRNEPVELPAMHPKEPNAMSNDTGNAGLDGYTVLSRASRYTGERPPAGTMEYVPDVPRLTEE